ARSVPEQRNAGLPAMSMMMRTTAGWAFPSSVPSVINDGPPGFRVAVGTRSQLSRLTQAAARTGMTRRAFMVPRGWDGGSDCNAERAPWPDCGDRVAAARRGHEASARRRRAGAVGRPRLESMMPDPVARGHHHPASFTGRTDGHVMSLTAMLTDTTSRSGRCAGARERAAAGPYPNRPAAHGALMSPKFTPRNHP